MADVIEFAAEAIIEYLLVGSVTAFVLVPLGWLIIRAGRIRAPVYRQLFWLYCLVGIALLPVLWLYGPKLTLAVLPAEAEPVEVISAPATEPGYDAVLVEEAVETFPLPQTTYMQVPPAAHSNTSSFPARAVLALLWLVGFAFMLARLAVGWYRLQRIRLTAMPVADRSFFSDSDGRRPNVLLTSQVAGPVCFGLFRPVVMMPLQIYEASAAGELRMVLNHELAHIERGDCWTNLFQRIAEAVFFFHPLVWWASLRLTQEREQICDNYVLARGASADEYSTLLARVVQRGPAKAQLPTMALFEGRLLQRVRFLLDPGRDNKTRLSIWAVLVCTVGLLSCLALLGGVRLEARSSADASDTDGLWEGHGDGGAYQWSWLDTQGDEEVTWTAEQAFETAAKYDSGDGGERPGQKKALRLYQRVLDANPPRVLELRTKARMGIRMTQAYDSELGETSLDEEAVRWYEQMLQDFKDWSAHQHLLEARVRLGDVYFMGPYGQASVEKAMYLYWEVINVPEEQVIFDEPLANLNLENIAKAKAKGRFAGSEGRLMEPPESANIKHRQWLLKQRKSFIDGIRRSAIWAITNKLGDKRLGPPGKELDRLLELKRKRPDDKYFQEILDGVIRDVEYRSLQQPERLRYDRPYHSRAQIRIDNRWPQGRVIDGAAEKYGINGPVYVFDPCDPKLHKSMGIAARCEMLRIFSFDFINDEGQPRLDVAFQFQDGKVTGGALFEVDLLDKDMNLLGTQRALELRNRQMPVERHGGVAEIGGDDPPNRSGKAELRFDKVPIAEVYAYRLTVLEPDLPLLLELLNEENAYLRESAVKALEQMGPDARATVPRLLKASQDERKQLRNPHVRVIHFPKDRSVGLLYVGQLRTTDPLWWQGWEEIGEAKGDVTVPPDKDVRLTVNAQGVENLSFLEALRPDDIQALEFSYADAKRVDDAALEHLAKLTGLRFLSLDNTSIRAGGLEHLKKLKRLEVLKLDSVEISDEALKHIGQISTLIRLGLARTPITDQGLAHLHGLTSLRNIALTQTRITGMGFSHLAGLESLTYAHLCDSGLTDEGLREVAKLKSLEILRLEGTKVTDRGVAHLERSKTLRELKLVGTDITDAGLDHVAEITPLESLDVPEGTTAAGLGKLTPLTNLKHLGIWQMRYTDDGLGPLRQFKNLRYLSLMTGITNEDLAAISTLSSLEELIMNSSPITNRGLAQLAALKSLKRLTLHHGHKSVNMDITVSGVGALKRLPLKYLQLGNIKLDDSRLNSLADFPELEGLDMYQMPICDDDLAAIGKLSRLTRLIFTTDTVSDGGLEHLAELTHLEDFQPLAPLTDIGLSHIGRMTMKGRLVVKGHFTDEGLRHLEDLASLRTLKLTTSGEISTEAKERLKRKLPNLLSCNVQRSREVRPRPKVGEAAPPFALKPLDEGSDSDEEIRLEGKAVLLYFWATWCSPCKASTPGLKRLYAKLKKRHGDRFVMLGLSLDSDETSVRRYVEKEAVPWPQICIGRDSQTAADYGVYGVPMYYVIGPDGRIVFSDHDGGDTIEAAVDRILGTNRDKPGQEHNQATAPRTNLEVLDVKFEPIRQGKNVVRVNVRNTSDQEQVFRLQIYTRSPDYGRNGVGWGTSFFDTVKPKEERWTRFVFKIQGPITDATYVRLDFHNPGPAAGFDREKYFEDRGPKKWFKRVKYSSGDLEHHKPDEIPTMPASQSESEAVIAVFREIQKLMTDKKYEQAWELFTKDCRDAEFQLQGFERFEKIMEPEKHPPIDSAFWWEKGTFLNLQAVSVVRKEPALVLSARDGDQTWKIDFVEEGGRWKIDWVAGYTPRILQWQNWETRLLGKMEERNTKHFDIHYQKASVAEKEIDEIAKNREAGYSAICEFLGTESQVRIKLVLFENERTKWFETGHQGRGWAYGNTTVEVYNEQEQLDPYHETTHVLMRPYGNPPALFNEGFAVYMSERLGAHALEDLSGGLTSIHERTKELKEKGEWIELQELITYTEIGSKESRPPVAYAEAASFVKFLIDQYGRDKFLEAYKTLQNSGEKQAQQQNIRELELIYGKSLQQLQEEWEKAFSS